MKFNIYCFYDMVDQSYSTVHLENKDAVAIRNFQYAIQTSNTILSHRREDFKLMKIGIFDSDTGIIDPILNPELIFKGEDVEDEVSN